MKRCAAVSIGIVCLLALEAQAVRFVGVRGGVSQAGLSTDTGDLERVDGNVVGLAGVFTLSPWVSFQPELLLSERGAKGRIELGSGGGFSAEGELTLKYLELPVLVRVNPPVDWIAKPYFVGGPALAVKLSGRASGLADGLGAPVDNEPVGDLAAIGDLEMVLGGGVQVGIGIAQFEVSGRYVRGLVDVDERFPTLKLKNSVWSFMVAFLIEIG